MPSPLPPEWDQWIQAGARLLAAPRLRRSEQVTRGDHDPKFAVGDFLATVPSEYVDVLAQALGAEQSQFRVYRDVAMKIPASMRVASSWTVHRDLRDHPGHLEPGLTVRQAAERLGKAPIDSPADSRLTVAVKAAKVRAFLADPSVYAVIETEMAASRQDRRDRSRARLVHTELAAKQKAAEAELHQARNARSPGEATVKASIQLLEAAQIVHAIGVSLDELPDSERLIEALRDLAAEVSTALTREQDQAFSAHDYDVIVGEVWQAPPARAALRGGSNQA